MTSADLSSIFVAPGEDAKSSTPGRNKEIISKLAALGYEAKKAPGLPVDISWTVRGQRVMWDLKKPEDMVASAEDGRLHEQLEAMKAASCLAFGFLIEGPDSLDDVTVGYGTHAWPIERYDNLLLSLQCEGAKIVRSTTPARTPARIVSLYKWSAKESHGSYHGVVAPRFTLKGRYTDKDWRKHVEGLMALFDGCGEELANGLLDRFTYAEILGATPAGIEAAATRWQSVPRIGPTLARRWQQYLLEDYSVPVKVVS